MQSSLCLRAACPVNANNQHPYVLRGLPDRSQLALNSSPLFSRRIINPCMRGHTTPPKADINKKDEVTGIGQLKSVAAAVVMTCTLGAMCTGQKAMARRIDLFRSPPSITSESDHAPASIPMRADTRKKSIQALREIFNWKCDFGTEKPAPTPKILFDTLRDELCEDEYQKLKKYLGQLENIEKSEAAVNSIFEEWKERAQNNDTYNIGLVLIDLLINQGDYKRAAFVCQNIESYAPKFDIRPKIRRAIIDMMLLADAVGSEVKESEKTRRLKRRLNSIVCKFIEIIQENLDPPVA